MKKNLTTPAGQTDGKTQEAYINAINQVFAIFRRNYHNQYYKALPDENELSIVKRIWLESLKRFPPETILMAAKSVIEASEFMPTLRTMIRHCEEQSDFGLPDAHNAYIEACRAPSPKASYAWTHLAVYYAGKQCDWYFLQSNSEDVAYPIFKKEYQQICQRILQGETLLPPQLPELPEKTETILDKKANLKNLKSLKDRLGF
ncbi:replication protein P [Agarilytica rhodophyticola]|uniref:replication protein P n=1 Tax=Agarilytica rhodophyticola TaxID=1737490 RepID=UPI000B3414BF|nr:replication protein P [Agarilytica rhodophyticola]